MANTTLKQRIETALRADGRWPVGSWGTPVQGRPPVVYCRYAGSVIDNGLRRRRAQVVMLIAPATSGEWNTGDGIETLEDELIAVLNDVDDCYPELLATRVRYDMDYPGGRHKWVALIVDPLGP